MGPQQRKQLTRLRTRARGYSGLTEALIEMHRYESTCNHTYAYQFPTPITVLIAGESLGLLILIRDPEDRKPEKTRLTPLGRALAEFIEQAENET